ncbi:MAG: gliding motility-associated C-terminal domain-containing protein, partial [Bacteroidota bacterium]
TGDFTTGYMDYVTLGNEELINLPTQIDMAEFIIFSRLLTAAERNKVESYLAVKYGFTLNQAAINNNNYTASNDSIVWNRSANSLYANNITGIGRDDSSGLMQKQSKSINSTAIVTMYNGANYTGGIFPSLNSLSTATFANNLSYIIFGENAGATNTMTQCVYSGKAKSISRVWKVGRIGTDSLVTLSVDNGNIPANAMNIMVSSDSTFPSLKTTIYPLTIANGKIYASVVLGNNTFFTYTTDTLNVKIAVVQPSCNKPNSGSMTATLSGAVSPYNYTWNTVPTQTNTPALNVSGGVYNLTVLMGGTCISTYPVSVKSGSLTTLSAKASPDTFCHGFTTQLSVSITGNTIKTYTWMPGGQNGTNIIVKPDTTTTFIVYGVDSSGCNDTAKIQVKVNPLPVISAITGNNNVCIGNSTQLSELTTGGVWNISNPTIATIDNSGKVTGLISGNTIVKYVVTDKNGCKDSVPLPIVVNKASLSNTPVSICPSDFPYSWNGNVYNSAGSYTVHLSNSVGCDSAATLILSSKSASSSAISKSICQSEFPYTWYTNTYNAPGTYSVHLTNAAGCDSAVTLTLTLKTITIDSIAISPSSPVGPQTVIQVQIISTSSIDSAKWTPANLFSSNNPSQSVTTPDTTFWIKVTGYSGGCFDTASRQIVVTNNSSFIPNAIAPTNTSDNRISHFMIYGTYIKSADLTIFNQWGQKIFHSDDAKSIGGKGWDGTYNGQLQPTGVYVYVVKITYLNNVTETKSGSVNLIR